MNNVRKDNVNNVIIACLNINSLANKFDQLTTVINDNIDILVLLETKLDDTFPESQFVINGFSKPYRIDRNRNGGGVMIYVRQDIPSKRLSKHNLPSDIECLCVEINLRKSKWLLCGTYHPPSQADKYYFEHLGRLLDIYSNSYEKMLLTGDFNAQEGELCIDSFLYEYNLKNLIKEKTCFKNPENPSCIDLFLTNSPLSFQNSTTNVYRFI